MLTFFVMWELTKSNKLFVVTEKLFHSAINSIDGLFFGKSCFSVCVPKTFRLPLEISNPAKVLFTKMLHSSLSKPRDITQDIGCGGGKEAESRMEALSRTHRRKNDNESTVRSPFSRAQIGGFNWKLDLVQAPFT